MSKKVKNLIDKELTANSRTLDGVARHQPRGIDGNQEQPLRRRLREKGCG